VTRPSSRRALIAALVTAALAASPALRAADAVVAPAPSASAAAVAPVDISPVAEHPVSSGLPAGWKHGAFMEVFVRGYQDSDGDGIGDLKGLTRRLDYLHELGIRGLWLMPITLSADHDHGYAVADFRQIEPAYGTWADFDELVRQAHRRGIAIVIDYVINHSAKQNPLFVASAASRDGPFRDWYVWEDVKPTGWDIFGHDPWTVTPNGAYFGQFGGHMPDFNLRNPRVVQYHLDSLRLWLNHGADGFRIDAVGHLFENGPKGWSLQPENYTFMRWLRNQFKDYGDLYWVCEAPGDARGFGKDSACGASFAFDESGALVDAARGDEKAIHAVADYWLTAPEGMATMVSNHDAFAGPRLWDAMKGDAARVRLAAATYLLQPGTPYLYYGEELGMSGTPAEDRDWKLRGPVSWTGDPRTAGFTTGMPYRAPSSNLATNNAEREAADPDSILAFYRAMIGLRNAHPSLALGRYVAPRVEGRVMSFQRTWRNERTVVVINYGTEAGTATVAGLAPKAKLRALYPTPTGDATAAGAPVADAKGVAHVAVGAESVHVYTLP
jgi:glycosidase